LAGEEGVEQTGGLVLRAGEQMPILVERDLDRAVAHERRQRLDVDAGSEAMYVFAPGQAAPAPWGMEVRVWKSAGTAVLDADAFGRLYTAPVELRSFEQDAGASNRQTFRMETNALYTVERVSAGLKIL
jgi:hypothetical protein